jgi:hypothetical protein
MKDRLILGEKMGKKLFQNSSILVIFSDLAGHKPMLGDVRGER